MPNTVKHVFRITGASGVLDCLTAIAGNGELIDFDRIIASPPGADREWRKKHWGSSSNARWSSVASGKAPTDTDAEMRFETNWEPAVKVIGAIAERFADLKFDLRFGDSDRCFGGSLTISKGGKVYRETFEQYEPEPLTDEELAAEAAAMASAEARRAGGSAEDAGSNRAEDISF